MVDLEAFRHMALSFEEATEEPHFEKVSFRIRKKIFATLDLDKKTAVLKLNEDLQAQFSETNENVIYPVKGAWGKQGWTVMELASIDKATAQQALKEAYCTVAPRSLTSHI